VGKNVLPREFEWHYQDEQGHHLSFARESRGDFKFGLAAGYVGSFKYHTQNR
jgi:hypothetical protein